MSTSVIDRFVGCGVITKSIVSVFSSTSAGGRGRGDSLGDSLSDAINCDLTGGFMQSIVSRDILASNSRVDFASCTMINLSYVPTLAHGSHEVYQTVKYCPEPGKELTTTLQLSTPLSNSLSIATRTCKEPFMTHAL